MPRYSQANRQMAVTTPLGEDVLLLTGLKGHEAISQLFHFQIDLLAERESEVPFDKLIGQNVTVELRLASGEKRHINGIIKRLTQGGQDDLFVRFRAELVPALWLLTKKIQSRIFQHLSVPDILHEVFVGMGVSYKLNGAYHPRDYCVQYSESDFDFASRIMEEEGIYYFFQHGADSHQMIVTDVAQQHPPIPGQSTLIYEEVSGGVQEMRVTSWEKSQELCSGEYTLRDYCFELPGNHLEAKEKILDSVAIGKVTHKLQVGENDKLEIYEYPGGYARRFDGVAKTGMPQPENLQYILEDRDRTARVRMEREEGASLEVAGSSNCGNFVPGCRFTLERHFDADDEYLLTRVEHAARLEGSYRSGAVMPFKYENHFTCVPAALPHRPPRVARKPIIAGIQTATVVGPPGEDIFCDEYGRVKVLFHWDREGKQNGDSSCWVRVAQVWAGKRWGAFFWPRVGNEVVVSFEEGDPDQPLIVGSVYNAENMPWFTLPANKELGGFKSASLHGTVHKNYNGIVFNDRQGHEHLSIHSERNLSLNSEYDKMIHSGRHKGERVGVANVFTVGNLIPGGGSGGGFDAGNTMPEPPAVGILGINSQFVYGENLQVACPMNHQLVVGSSLQVCINPLGLVAGVPDIPAAPTMTSLLGSGVGGNMQLTMGSSAQITMGQSMEISFGPPKMEWHESFKDHVATCILCGVLGAAAILWVLLYDKLTGDKERANLAIVFQLLFDALLVAILGVEMAKKVGNQTVDEAFKPIFRVRPEDQALDKSNWAGYTFCTTAAALALVIAPLEATGSEE